jgi:hypothetical protein
MWGQYFNLNYYYYWTNSYQSQWYQYYPDFQYYLTTFIILFVSFELIILIRDHQPKFYPLEPEFRHFIRFFTPPYLLAGFGLFIFFLSPNHSDFTVWGTAIILFGILWANFRNHKVSPRFYIFNILFIFFASIYINDDIFFTLMYVVPLYLGYVLIKALRNFKPKPKPKKQSTGVIRLIKNWYSEYYNQ